MYHGTSKKCVGPTKKKKKLRGANTVKNHFTTSWPNNVVLMDEFSISLELFVYLQKHGTYVMGTTCYNRIGIPKEQKSKENNKKYHRRIYYEECTNREK